MGEAEAAVGAEAACIALYDPSDERLTIKFASGEKGAEVKGVTLALGQGILGEAASTDTTVRVDVVKMDSRFESAVDEQTHFSTRSILATPIRRRQSLLGVLEVINKRGELVFSEADACLLEIVAGQAAIAIDNACLLERTLRSARLSAVGQMASSLIHDFKTPLTLIQGFVELLSDPATPVEDRQQYSDLIQEEVQHFLIEARGLLEYSRGETRLNREEIQIDEWLGSIADVLRQNLSGANIQLNTKFEYRGKVWIDQEKMRRVVMNMISNSQDAMTDGGSITISTARQGQNWLLGLHDTGSGIPIEQRSKIFDLFATFGKKNGTGLGLAMAMDIVQGHSGSIRVESWVVGENGSTDSGTSFIISCPISQPVPGIDEEIWEEANGS